MAKKKNYEDEPTPLETSRVLFNWGFHDGAHEYRIFDGESPIRQSGWRNQTPVYAEGYDMGQELARCGGYDFERGTLSSDAWNEFHASKRGTEILAMPAVPVREYVDAVEEANMICDELERQKNFKK